MISTILLGVTTVVGSILIEIYRQENKRLKDKLIHAEWMLEVRQDRLNQSQASLQQALAKLRNINDLINPEEEV